MIRKIIHIDEDRCNGCGLCVSACHEGAIGMNNGKATLLRDDYCDGLGDCLPVCPTGAITFEEREAAPYDEAAVLARASVRTNANAHSNTSDHASARPAPLPCGCPGSAMRSFARATAAVPAAVPASGTPCAPTTALTSAQPCAHAPATPACPSCAGSASGPAQSQLAQWPVQIKLVPPAAPFFADADLLIAADCAAYACGDFHNAFMRGRVTLIGCPKLDDGDYADKLSAIFTHNSIRSVTLTRMEVPCCGGLERAVSSALQRSGKAIPLRVVVIATDGTIRES